MHEIQRFASQANLYKIGLLFSRNLPRANSVDFYLLRAGRTRGVFRNASCESPASQRWGASAHPLFENSPLSAQILRFTPSPRQVFAEARFLNVSGLLGRILKGGCEIHFGVFREENSGA